MLFTALICFPAAGCRYILMGPENAPKSEVVLSFAVELNPPRASISMFAGCSLRWLE